MTSLTGNAATDAPPLRNKLVPIGTLLMSAIVHRGLTLKEVAGAAHMQPAQLTRTITGRSDPRWSTIERLCEALDMNPAELFCGKEDQ